MLNLIIKISLLFSFNSTAKIYNTLYTVDRSTGGEVASVNSKYLPPDTTQDGFGNCFASVGATYGDFLNCRTKDKDCKQDPNQLFSRIAIGKFADLNHEEYTDIPGIFPKDARNANNILIRLLKDKKARTPSQACASIEKALVNFNDSEQFQDASVAFFDGLEKKYNQLHPKVTDKFKDCADCSITMTGFDEQDKEDFGQVQATVQNQNQAQVLKAFAQDSYSEFLEKLLIPPECARAKYSVAYEGPRNLAVIQFPESDYSKTANQKLEESMKLITNVLKTDTPLIVNGLCLTQTYNTDVGCKGTTKDMHSLIITGSRKICTKKDPSSSNQEVSCRYSVKVQNSLGAGWQKTHNDGWVDAESLLDRTGFKKGMLTWVDKENTTASVYTKSNTQNSSVNR